MLYSEQSYNTNRLLADREVSRNAEKISGASAEQLPIRSNGAGRTAYALCTAVQILSQTPGND